MKKWTVLFGIFVILVLVFAINCKSPASSEAASPFIAADSGSGSSSSSDTGSGGGGSSGDTTTTTLGSLTLKMTDNPIEEAEKIIVIISSIQVHYADEDEFIELPYDEFPYDLLELKKHPATLSVASLKAGHYNQIRLEVTKGWIIFPDDNGEEELDTEPPNMKIPSGKIKIPVQFHIEADGMTKLVLDFDADKSIKVTKRGKKDSYILRPVINVVDVSYE